jgi:phage-related protein
MPQSFFIWNGIDCRSRGIYLRGPAPIIRAEERISHVQIPGVSGDLTETEGENIYNSYIQTITMSVQGGARVREVYQWLRGAGYVTFSGEPDRRQKARIIGAITLNRLSRNLDIWSGEVQFYCQPYKELLWEKTTEVTASGTTVKNTGDVDERPMIKLTASGTSAQVAVGGKSIAITGLTSGQKIWLDSETMEALSENKTESLTAATAGEFPVLTPGDNVITGTGWSRLDITRRERFL